MRILHAKPENACAKMSEFGSFCVHHVALNGEAVKSNDGSLLGARGYGLLCQIVLPQGEAVTAVCDIYEDRIRCAADAVEAAAGKKPAEYTDFHDLLEDANVNTVIIATGWESHAEGVKGSHGSLRNVHCQRRRRDTF